MIGILGEYDALPGLSQESGIAKEKQIPGKEYGHGCGHNLLGGGALILKEYIELNSLKGTIRYFGCPAEEGGAGKAFMLREGCFEGLDAVLYQKIKDHINIIQCNKK